MKIIDYNNISNMVTEVTIYDLIKKDGISIEDVSRLIRAISDNFESYDVDSIILNSIVEIFLENNPYFHDLDNINRERLEELLKIT